jgi:hypothetical protein
MSTPVAAMNLLAEYSTSSDTGAANKPNDDTPSHLITNGQPAQNLSEVSLPLHREAINGISEPNTRPSPASTSTPTLQVESVSIRNGNLNNSTRVAYQADTAEPEGSRGSASAIENPRPADKRKRGKHNIVDSSSDTAGLREDSSEHGTVLKFGLNTEETLRCLQFHPFE